MAIMCVVIMTVHGDIDNEFSQYYSVELPKMNTRLKLTSARHLGSWK